MKESIIFHLYLIATSPAIVLHIPICWLHSLITSKLIKSLLNKSHLTGKSENTELRFVSDPQSTPPPKSSHFKAVFC